MDTKKRYKGVIVEIAYYAEKRDNDHVTVRLSEATEHESTGDLVPTYRNAVEKTGPQECVEEHWRRSDLR